MIYVVKSLPIFKLFSCFLIVDFWVLLYIFGTKLFCQVIYRYILSVCGLCFHFPNSVICRAKGLNFGKVQLISFSYIIPKFSLLTQGLDNFLLASKSFKVSFYISIFDPFWVNCIIEDMRYRLRIFFFYFSYGCQVFLPALFDKTVNFFCIELLLQLRQKSYFYGSLCVFSLCLHLLSSIYLCLPASHIFSVLAVSLFWFSLPFSLFLSPFSKWNVWVNTFSLKDSKYKECLFSLQVRNSKNEITFTVTQFFSEFGVLKKDGDPSSQTMFQDFAPVFWFL